MHNKSSQNIWNNYIFVEEPSLSFHINEPYLSKMKIEGLFNWGPFDSSVANNPLRPPNPLKVGIITIQSKNKIITSYFDFLNKKIEADDLYLKPYKGFREIYGINIELQEIESFDKKEIDSCNSEVDVFDLYKKKIANAKDNHDFNVLILIIPSEFENWLEVKRDNYYFHLHDKIKLFSASQSIRTQIIRMTRIPDFSREKELLRNIWWLSGAIYTKAGGVLYKLSDFNERILYVGLSYALEPYISSHKVLIGVAQLFDEQGNNIRLSLFQTSDFTIHSRNQFLNENASRNIF